MAIYPIKVLISNTCNISNKLLMFIYQICVYVYTVNIGICPNEEIHSFGALPVRPSVYHRILETFQTT